MGSRILTYLLAFIALAQLQTMLELRRLNQQVYDAQMGWPAIQQKLEKEANP